MSATPLSHELRSAELVNDLLSGRSVLRVTYRERHTRPWLSFVIVPAEGETVEALAAKIWPAIEEHSATRSRRSHG